MSLQNILLSFFMGIILLSSLSFGMEEKNKIFISQVTDIDLKDKYKSEVSQNIQALLVINQIDNPSLNKLKYVINKDKNYFLILLKQLNKAQTISQIDFIALNFLIYKNKLFLSFKSNNKN